MTNTPIVVNKISGKDFIETINKIQDACIGLPFSNIFISLIGLAIILQKPEIEPEHLQEGIKGCSEWIVTYLDSIEYPTAELPKEQIN